MASGGQGDLTLGQGNQLGFPQEIVIGGKVDSKFLCALCERVLRTPMQSFCGHRFCKKCINALLVGKESEVCPSCKKEDSENEFSVLKLDQIFPDNAIKRDFTTVKVKCLNHGCPWTGNLKIYEEHEKSCEYLSVQCELCGEYVSVPKKQAHDAKECPQRPWTCPHCQHKCPANEMQDHLNVECPLKPLDCPYCNVTGILRQQLLNHYEKECTSKLTMCRVVRCGHVGKPQELAKHKTENALGHIDNINDKLVHLERDVRKVVSQQPGARVVDSGVFESVNSRIEQLQREVQNVTAHGFRTDTSQETGGAEAMTPSEDAPANRALEQRMTIQDQKISTFDSIAAVLNSEILKCYNKIDETMTKINATQTQVAALQQKVTALEESNREKDELLVRIQRDMSLNTETSYDGTYTWKVTDVGRRRQEAITGRITSIYSPGFYTSRTGYRMCLRMYLNGDGMGRGSHLSVYFVLMRGQYDPLLKWPFRQKVTLMLLDHNRREHVIDAFRPDPSSSSFKQPTSEMNIASGCPLFTPLATLDTSSTNKLYIKDDVLFMKCIVDTSDLV